MKIKSPVYSSAEVGTGRTAITLWKEPFVHEIKDWRTAHCYIHLFEDKNNYEQFTFF